MAIFAASVGGVGPSSAATRQSAAARRARRSAWRAFLGMRARSGVGEGWAVAPGAGVGEGLGAAVGAGEGAGVGWRLAAFFFCAEGVGFSGAGEGVAAGVLGAGDFSAAGGCCVGVGCAGA